MARPRPDTSVVKRCSGCKETLPRENFSPSKTTFDQLSAYCRPCANKRYKKWRKANLETANRLQRDYYKKHTERFYDYELKAHYGLPYGTYDKMLEAQSGRCAICGTLEPRGVGKRFHVDHCHETGVVRGLLCIECNIGIGKLKHSEDTLHKAIEYLQKYPI